MLCGIVLLKWQIHEVGGQVRWFAWTNEIKRKENLEVYVIWRDEKKHIFFTYSLPGKRRS